MTHPFQAPSTFRPYAPTGTFHLQHGSLAHRQAGVFISDAAREFERAEDAQRLARRGHTLGGAATNTEVEEGATPAAAKAAPHRHPLGGRARSSRAESSHPDDSSRLTAEAAAAADLAASEAVLEVRAFRCELMAGAVFDTPYDPLPASDTEVLRTEATAVIAGSTADDVESPDGRPIKPAGVAPLAQGLVSAGAELLDAFINLDRPSTGTPHRVPGEAGASRVAAASPLVAQAAAPLELPSMVRAARDGATAEDGRGISAQARRVWLEPSGEGTATLRFSGREESRVQLWLFQVSVGLLLLLMLSRRSCRPGTGAKLSSSWRTKPRWTV